MSNPLLEVADIFRAYAGRFIDILRKGNVSWPELKVIRAIEACRTGALGKHRDRCTTCGKEFEFSFNSCRNRHCPKCQTSARNRWVAARSRELVPANYFHAVFTVPHELSPLMLQNKRLLYDLLFRSVADTLLEVAANPKRFGAEIGFLAILHTWGQKLVHHPHLHCVIPAGGFSPGRNRWIRPQGAGFFLPVAVLSQVFRGKFTDGLKRLFRRHKLQFHGSVAHLQEPGSFAHFLRTLHSHHWVVYLKKPFGGPEHVLHYLARYTHRVAISNHRLIALRDGNVTFTWKDYAHKGKRRVMSLAAEEFIRRFMLHLLPRGFVRIRQYGWMANRCRGACLKRCRELLGADPAPPPPAEAPTRKCPACGGPIETEIVLPCRPYGRQYSRPRAFDTS